MASTLAKAAQLMKQQLERKVQGFLTLISYLPTQCFCRDCFQYEQPQHLCFITKVERSSRCDIICKAVNPLCLQILRIDRDGILHDIIKLVTSFLVISHYVFYAETTY